MAAQHQLARAVVHLLGEAGEEEVHLVQPVRGPEAAGVVGVEVEAHELGEDLLVVVLDPAEELPEQVGGDFGILLRKLGDELRQPAVDRLQTVPDALAFGRVQALGDLLQPGVEILELGRVGVLHSLQQRLAQALKKLVEGPARPEAVRGVGVAAMKDTQLLHGRHGRKPCRVSRCTVG